MIRESSAASRMAGVRALPQCSCELVVVTFVEHASKPNHEGVVEDMHIDLHEKNWDQTYKKCQLHLEINTVREKIKRFDCKKGARI